MTTLVILHGANGSAATMAPMIERLPPEVAVESPDLLGHGGRPTPDAWSVAEMADDLAQGLDQRGVGPAFFFGYSFGAYLALYLASRFPERVRGVCGLAAKYVYDAQAVSHLTHLLDPERLSRPGNPRAEQLARTHAPQDWRTVTLNNRAMFTALGDEPALSDADLRAITAPVLLLSGETDQLVPKAETLALGKLLPRARVGLFPGAAHPLEETPLPSIVQTLLIWMAQVEAA